MTEQNATKLTSSEAEDAFTQSPAFEDALNEYIRDNKIEIIDEEQPEQEVVFCNNCGVDVNMTTLGECERCNADLQACIELQKEWTVKE